MESTNTGVAPSNAAHSAEETNVIVPEKLPFASAGTSVQVSRADHVHPFPSLNNCTDTLLVSKGGTGATTFTTNGVLYGNGTGALRTSNVGTNNQALLSNNGVPTFTTLIMAHISDSGDVPRIADTGLTCSDFT